MNDSFIDYHRISKAISSCAEALRKELHQDEIQFNDLQEAEYNLRQALSFGLSKSR